VQNLVAAGHVSATTAAQVVREHGDGAGKVLGAELEKAQASGKKRVTAGSMKGPSIPKPRLEAVHAASRNLIASLDSIDEDSRSLTLPTALVLQLREALDGAKPR